MIKGKDLIVTLGGEKIAVSKSCKLDLQQEFIKACAPTEGRTMRKIPTTYDWNVSADGLVSTSTQPNRLADLLILGTRCLLTFTDQYGFRRAGFVYVKSFGENGSIGSFASYSVAFEADGPLYYYQEYKTVPFAGGENISLEINPGVGLDYNFDNEDADLNYVSPYVAKKGKFYVIGNGSWAGYKCTPLQMKSLLATQDASRVNQALLPGFYGFDEMEYDITQTGTYTFLAEWENMKVYYLYEP